MKEDPIERMAFPISFLTLSARIRGVGTAAVNMCLVASGAADAYYEMGIHCWDMAGAGVIVTEAGGVLLDVTGSGCSGKASSCPSAGLWSSSVCVCVILDSVSIWRQNKLQIDTAGRGEGWSGAAHATRLSLSCREQRRSGEAGKVAGPRAWGWCQKLFGW